VILLRLELGREFSLNPAQGLLRFVEVPPRVPHLGQVEPGTVAHAGRYVPGQQCLKALASLVVHAERQIQAPEQQLAFILVMWDQLPLLIGHEARDRLEVLILIEIKEYVAIVQIANTGNRQLLRIMAAGSSRAARRCERNRGTDTEQGYARHGQGTYSQSLISNSGCWRRWRSLILSSRYLAPMPFSNLSVAPRL